MDLHHTSEHAGRPTSFRRSVPYSVSNTYSATAHHALIDVPDIYFGNILAQYAKPSCAGNLRDFTSELSVCTHLHHRASTLITGQCPPHRFMDFLGRHPPITDMQFKLHKLNFTHESPKRFKKPFLRL